MSLFEKCVCFSGYVNYKYTNWCSRRYWWLVLLYVNQCWRTWRHHWCDYHAESQYRWNCSKVNFSKFLNNTLKDTIAISGFSEKRLWFFNCGLLKETTVIDISKRSGAPPRGCWDLANIFLESVLSQLSYHKDLAYAYSILLKLRRRSRMHRYFLEYRLRH